MIAAAGAAGVGEDEDALLVIHERLRLGEIGRTGAVLDDEPIDASGPACTIRRERPVTSATMSVPKRWMIWSSAPWTGGNDAELFDHPVAAFDGLAALDRLAVAIDGPRRQIALAVGERLVELGREANARDNRGRIRAA